SNTALPPSSPLFPYTTLFRSVRQSALRLMGHQPAGVSVPAERCPHEQVVFGVLVARFGGLLQVGPVVVTALVDAGQQRAVTTTGDRKSTRLNSSHVKISYAVF